AVYKPLKLAAVDDLEEEQKGNRPPQEIEAPHHARVIEVRNDPRLPPEHRGEGGGGQDARAQGLDEHTSAERLLDRLVQVRDGARAQEPHDPAALERLGHGAIYSKGRGSGRGPRPTRRRSASAAAPNGSRWAGSRQPTRRRGPIAPVSSAPATAPWNSRRKAARFAGDMSPCPRRWVSSRASSRGCPVQSRSAPAKSALRPRRASQWIATRSPCRSKRSTPAHKVIVRSSGGMTSARSGQRMACMGQRSNDVESRLTAR